MAKDEAILSRCLTGLNGAVPYPIGAFPLLREELWHGRLGGFLLRRLDLSPFRPWNVIFLPLDSGGKSALGLPIGTPSHSALNELETIVEMICELCRQAEPRGKCAGCHVRRGRGEFSVSLSSGDSRLFGGRS